MVTKILPRSKPVFYPFTPKVAKLYQMLSFRYNLALHHAPEYPLQPKRMSWFFLISINKPLDLQPQ